MERHAQDFEYLKSKKLPAENVAFFFATDLHTDAYLWEDEQGELTVYETEESIAARTEKQANALRAAVELANECDAVDFIALGGDVLNGYCLLGKDFAIENRLLVTLAPLRECKKPVLLAFGNHDDNAFQVENPTIADVKDEWIISDRDWKNRVLAKMPGFERFVFDPLYPDSKYYYCDLPEKKTRVVVLDTLDCRRPYDESGAVCGAPQSHGFTYTAEQLKWLVEQALTCAPDWQYIFLSHMGIDASTNSNLMGNGEALRALLRAVQWQTPYSYYGLDYQKQECKLSANYRKHPVGRVRMFAFGHQHAELVVYSEDLDLWQICAASMTPAGGFSGLDESLPWNFVPWRDSGRETCIEYISVGEKGCYKYSLGPGAEVEMLYPTK